MGGQQSRARRDSAATRHRVLYLPRDSIVHSLDPATKIVGTVAFVVAVALVPRTQILPVLVNAAVAISVVFAARLPARAVLVRLTSILPFVLFALLIPFVGSGSTVEVVGLALSVDGLWASWAILSKSFLGALASIVLSASTPLPSLLGGLSQLRVPAAIVAIVAFMFRYLDVILDEINRMRTAMVARAHDPRWIWQAKPIATAAGTLFVRSYERGERAHLAMVARGYTGAMPDLGANQNTVESRRANLSLAFGPAFIAWLNLVVVFGIGFLR